MSFDHFNIYEGDEVVCQLCSRPYYANILARVVFKKSDYGLWRWKPYKENREQGTFPAWINEYDRLETKRDIKSLIVDGDVYIVSVHNRFHSQLMMPRIDVIHFNCTKRELYECWRSDQTHWYNNSDHLTFDENGTVIQNDNQTIGMAEKA